MKTIDKKLIILLGILLAVVMVVRVIPLLKDKYNQDQAEIGRLEVQVERFKRLVEEEQQLAQTKAIMEQQTGELENSIFNGSTESLIGSSVQRQLRQVADQSNINVREMSVAEYDDLGDWLRISQQMTFTIQQRDIINFFRLLDNSTPRLHIAEFGITRTQRLFNANITVIGFSPSLSSSNTLFNADATNSSTNDRINNRGER